MSEPVLSGPVIEISNLSTYFYVPDGVVKAVDSVNLKINKREVVGVVGESGSGKSVTALSVMRLLSQPPAKIISGEARFLGEDLMKKNMAAIRKIRGGGISMIFQNPYTALNPLIHIGDQLVEAVVQHRSKNRGEARDMVLHMLKEVGVTNPSLVMKSYPFDVSAGVCQRSMLAMALLCQPQLLIADEPTTLLDAIAQVGVLTLIKKMKDDFGMAVWYISHDFGAIALMSDRIMVMYAGKSVEEADAQTILTNTKHPYSEGLINSVPIPGKKVSRLKQISGEVPNPMKLPTGCSFNPRCGKVMDICRREEPPVIQLNENHTVRCWLYA